VHRFFRALLTVLFCEVREQSRARNLDLVIIELLCIAFVQKAIEENFDFAKHGSIQFSERSYAEEACFAA
jgi:hypothetical protein